jgi:tetratricopeptide (TPR) repeat protein
MQDEQLCQIGGSYVSAITALAPNAERIVDKMPMNFLFAGLIHLVLPDARIIHMRRDPIDTCLSCFSKLFADRHLYSYDLGELGRYYRAYEMLMEHWRKILPPGFMLEVQYENLTANLDDEARRIVSHCDLEWDAACLSFHAADRSVRTASAAQVRQPIYRSSIGRWRGYEHLLGPLIEALGVDVTRSSKQSAPLAGAGDGCAIVAAEKPAGMGRSDVADLLAAGRKLHETGRFAEAEIQYQRVLATQPDNADALNLLGIVAYRTGRQELAVELFQQAIQKNGRDPSYFSNLGNAFHGQGRLDEAVAAYRQAITIKPDYAEAHSNLGVTLEQQGKLDEAMSEYHQAIRIKPDYADAYSNLGVALEEQGKLDQALDAFKKAIELAPNRAVTYRLLGDVKRFSANDPHLAAMEEMAQNMASLSAEDQIDLHFALGKAHADVDDHEQSFRNLLLGNALKRQRISYDGADIRELCNHIRSLFAPELMRSKRGLGDPSPKPVFIIGMPRSGTTLVEQILASHHSVFGAGELDYVPNTVEMLSGRDAVWTDFEEQVRQLGASYLRSINTLAPNAVRIVDKMPVNFLFAGLIHLALPNARLIHTHRDPIDTCVSCFSKLFTKGNLYSYDLAELGGYYRAYESLMEHWRRVLPPGVMLEVQYENVIANLDGEARRIIAHCGLEWEDACLSFYETDRPVRTTVEVRQSIYRSSIGRWRRYEHHLGPLIAALGLDVPRNSDPRNSVRESSHVPGGGVADSVGTAASSLSEKSVVMPETIVGEGRLTPHQRDAPENPFLLDAVKAVTIHNGLLRIDCVGIGTKEQERLSGILLIPASQARQILRSMVQAVHELKNKLRQQA